MISVEKVARHNKLNKLINVLIDIDNEENREGTIIFVNKNRTADFLAAYISEQICPAISVHDGRYNWQIRDAVQLYESREIPILVGTSVDLIVRCAHIINFDVPIREDGYPPRIGRTNQTGSKPNVITFFNETQETSFGTLGQVFVNIVKAANE